jgi:glycosyltransferase involved in cell wall biosynthesis
MHRLPEAGFQVRSLKLFFYRPGVDFRLAPKFCYIPVPLILDTPVESAATRAADPSLGRFHAITHDWRHNLLWKNYRCDPNLFQVAADPNAADCFVFPYLLDELIETIGVAGVSAALRRLPHFSGNERRHLFMTLHDSSERFELESLIYRASVRRTQRDTGTSAIPYAVEDLGGRTHFEPSRILYDASFAGFIGCSASGPVRRQVIASLARADRIRTFTSPCPQFHGHQSDSERQARRELFLKSIADSWMVVCPRGTGVNTYRFFETLSMGRIPVLLSDDCLLPFEDRIDYDAFILRIAEKDAGRTADIIADWMSTQTADTLLARCRRARRTWESYFACPQWNRRIIETLKKLREPEPSRVVIDGVIFQLQRGRGFGISRLWRSLLAELGRGSFASRILLLDRDGTAPEISGITTRRTAGYRIGSAAEGAAALDALCRQAGAGLFISTYYTCTRETPSLLTLYDMIPEREQAAGPSCANPEWRDKRLAVDFAAAYAAISRSTADDLNRFYPRSASRPREVIPCAAAGVFREHSAEEVAAFRAARGLIKPYFMLVGRRDPHKNQQLFFDAFSRLPDRDRYAVVMAGGGRQDPQWQALLGGADAFSGFFPDDQLPLLYSGALALVYPSLYEGFGLPLLEAMQSGCPVITCHNSSIFEVAGNAALYVDERDPADLAGKLLAVQDPGVRRYLLESGRERARRFSWEKSARLLEAAIAPWLEPRKMRQHPGREDSGFRIQEMQPG